MSFLIPLYRIVLFSDFRQLQETTNVHIHIHMDINLSLWQLGCLCCWREGKMSPKDGDMGHGTGTRRQETNRQNANFIFSSFWRRGSCKLARNTQTIAQTQHRLLSLRMIMIMMMLYPCRAGRQFQWFFSALWLCWHFYVAGKNGWHG